MCGFKKKKKKKIGGFSAPVPRKADKFSEAAAEEERKRVSGLYGRRATILTGGSGLTNAAPTVRPLAFDQ